VFAGDRQGVVTTVFIASAPLGFAISQFGGPILADAFGWKAVFVAYPLLSALGYIVFRLSRPSAIRTGDQISPESSAVRYETERCCSSRCRDSVRTSCTSS